MFRLFGIWLVFSLLVLRLLVLSLLVLSLWITRFWFLVLNLGLILVFRSWFLGRILLFVLDGFFLFRLFDIVKFPPPIRRLERLGGGRGIVADDLMAGLYTNIVLIIIVYITGS